MPKELKEIRNFTEGTILNASERDIPGDSNIYSLNINPIAEHGILDAVKIDRFACTINSKETFFRDPVSWSATNNIDATTGNNSYNYPGIYIDDISVFNNDGIVKLNFTGTKGRKEQLLVKNIEPVFQDTATNLVLASELLEADTYIHVTVAFDDVTSLRAGDYFSLIATGGTFTGRYGNYEIFQMESYDSTTRFLYVKRRCFGTSSEKISNSTDLDIYAGRIKVGGTAYYTGAGTATLYGWSDYSGNHIGGNSHYLNYSSTTANKSANGYIVTDGSNSTVVFAATTGTITFGTDIPDVNFYEGDIITTYYNGGSGADLNCGKSFKILKKVTAGGLVLTVAGADGDTMTTDNLGSGVDFYMESNIVKNFTLAHSIDLGSTVGTNRTKKMNDWKSQRCANSRNNFYASSDTDRVIWGVAFGGTNGFDTDGTYEENANVWDADIGPYGDETGDDSAFYYPFTDADSDTSDTTRHDAMVKIISTYSNSNSPKALKVGTATTDTDIELEFQVGHDDIGFYLAEGDYFYIDDTGVAGISDYMRVISAEGNRVTVKREAFSTTLNSANITNGQTPHKNNFNSIAQEMHKDRFKSGQEYILSFYAQGRDVGSSDSASGDADENEAQGALAISFNGGYINSDGAWTAFKKDPKSGYAVVGDESSFAQNYRWVNFTECDNPNEDSTDQLGGIDHVWRRFDFKFTIPRGETLETNVMLEMASIGIKDSWIFLDLITIKENTRVYATIEDGERISNAFLIDNKGQKVLAMYDSSKSFLSAIEEFDINKNSYEHGSAILPILSAENSHTINSSRNSASFVANNREVHIGLGGSNSDSAPQWLGYVNHKVFGEDNTNKLYQDEDTVHTYDEASINTLSKVCLAGEFECLASTGTTTLQITLASHPFEVGDNIVVREWMDTNNDWNGSGVWVVTVADQTNTFDCTRNTINDFAETAAPSNGKVSVRPYYYYGCKDGDDRIYRVTPSIRFANASTVDTEYAAGKMEASLPLPGPIKSITTCHNKVDAGTGGGRVYGLSSNSDEVYVINVNIAYDKWKESTPSIHALTLAFKSFKWSNDAVTGDLSNGDAVFESVAATSSPTIVYAGVLSDILETKGTAPSFDIDSTANNNAATSPDDFDTRLWVQCAPAGDSTFTVGSRFLFCGLTNSSNADSVGTIYCGDRTPPTTPAVDDGIEYGYGDNNKYSYKFNGGPGQEYDKTGTGAMNFFRRGFVYGRLENIRPIRKPSTASYSTINAHNVYSISYLNFGDNVGWVKENEGDDSDIPAIRVAKYGIFQMGDNDCDGLIDGTGVVCANNRSIQGNADHTHDDSIKLYGDLHRRVTSHVVGLIGSCDKPWFRNYAKVAKKTGQDQFYHWRENSDGKRGKYGMDSPCHLSVNNCIFVCSDIHFGDKSARYPDNSFGGSTTEAASFIVAAGDVTDADFDVTSGTWTDEAVMVELTADQLEKSGLQAGDMVFCMATANSSDRSDYSFNTYVAAIKGKSNAPKLILPVACHEDGGTTKKYADNALRIFPHSPYAIFPMGNGYGGGSDAALSSIANQDVWGSDPPNNYKIYHYAFNDADPGDGTVFTEGYAAGKYGRTFLTYDPAGFDGTSTNANLSDDCGFSFNSWRPGVSWTMDRLNFRAGYMIRPFSSDAGTFEDLVLGNNLCIESPCWPSVPIYHENDGSNLHYSSSDNSEVNNLFSNKLFITNKQEELSDSTTGNQTKIYQIDMSLMYPEVAQHVPLPNLHSSSTSYNTDGADGYPSWDIMCAGDVMGYTYATTNAYEAVTLINADDANQQPYLNATYCPIVKVKGGSDMFYESTIFGTDSAYRNSGQIAGTCLTIVDAYTGKMQTRYIVYSHNAPGASGDGKDSQGFMYLSVHYPFAHIPTTDDKWFIWRHPLVCTAPVKLNKETILSHDIPNANSSAIPQIITNTASVNTNDSGPYLSTGSITVLNSTDTLADATTSTFHGLSTNDEVIISDAPEGYNPGGSATYAITVTGPKTFTFTTVAVDMTDASTGTWTLANSKGSTSNPLLLELAAPITITTFGGLDMRKTRSVATTTLIDASDDLRITSTDHRLAVGDSITFVGGHATHHGQYIVKEGAAALPSATEDTFEIANKTTDYTDNGTWHTNQWETVLFETGGNAGIGELRSGFLNWDKGNIAGNLIRYDSTADADTYLNFTEGSVNISASPSSTSGDYFQKNTTYDYKLSLMYDGYQEGPLSTITWNWSSTSTSPRLYLDIKVKNYSKRLSHICVYRRNTTDDFFSLVKQIKTESGWGYSEGVWSRTLTDKGTIGATYESRSGLSEVLDTIKLKYGLSVEIDGYLFAGDCGHSKIENASNIIFRSKPGSFSVFDYANDFLAIKSKPTAMANFLGRLYVFDSNNIYKINQHNLAIEDTFEGVGCLGKDSVMVTEYGMFFADKNGAYKHDGTAPLKISEGIQEGGTTTTFGVGETVSPTDNINDVSWNHLVRDRGAIPMVTFDSNSGSALFVMTYHDKFDVPLESASTMQIYKTINQHYVWSFNISRNRWDLWELDANVDLGVPILGKMGEVIIPIDNALYELQGGSSKKDYTWISKKLNASTDSVQKIFKKIKVNGIEGDLNLGGSNKESSDRLFVSTNAGTIASSDLTYTAPSTGHGDYKVGGSNKAGRWIQVKLENMTKSVDSLGVIFRRKRIK